jgi:hypothetical protein
MAQIVLGISGSPSSKSRTALVAQHVLELLKGEDIETKFLSVARHIVQSHFIPEKAVTIQDSGIALDPATSVPLGEAVHHFKASLGLIAIDSLMGHPGPVRPTLENSSIPFNSRCRGAEQLMRAP